MKQYITRKRPLSPNAQPPICVVVIGLNVAKYLRSALQAIHSSDYPRELLEIIYVDSGSTDGSVEIAESFTGVHTVELDDDFPNAAKGRNAGLAVASHNLIQFVDADSYLHPQWLKTAVLHLQGRVAAVAGSLRERKPDQNLFHRMADLEWNLRPGKSGWTTDEVEARGFGGNVLIQRLAFQLAGTYDETLPAGEDPDLSYRFRQAGFSILRINTEMASHDINIQNLRAFAKRSRRSGFVYASLAWRYGREAERFGCKESYRIAAGVLAPWVILLAGTSLGYPLISLLLSGLIMFRLLFRVGEFSRVLGLSTRDAVKYSLYLAFVIYPQFPGLLSGYWIGLRSRIMLNRSPSESFRVIDSESLAA